MKEGKKCCNLYLTITQHILFTLRLYGVGHMVKDYSDSERGNHCCHIGYSFRLATRVLLYAPSHRQDSTYHNLCCTSRKALAGTRNSSVGPSRGIDPTTHRTMSDCSYHGAISCFSASLINWYTPVYCNTSYKSQYIFEYYDFLHANFSLNLTGLKRQTN